MNVLLGRAFGPVCLGSVLVLALGACNQAAETGLLTGGSSTPKPVETRDDLRRTYGKGRRAEDRQLYEVALGYYREAAPAGYAPALIGLGRLYALDAPEIPRDYARAAAFYRQAIDRGAGYDAELPYGVMNLQGLGVPADPVEAERWFRRGALTVAEIAALAERARARDAEAGLAGLLARLFAPFAKPDAFEAALAWARGLATQEPATLYAESLAYRRGIERPVDLVLADRLRERAAERGQPEAAHALGLARLYPPEGSDPDVQGGLQVLWQAAEGGLVPAQSDLARYYAEASDHPLDQERAYYWLLRARNGGAEPGALLPRVEGRLESARIDLVTRNLDIGWVYPP